MARGPDPQSRRGAEHRGAHPIGAQALQRGDDAVGHPGTDGVAPALVVQGDNANWPDYLGPDGGGREAVRTCRGGRPGRRLACPRARRRLLTQRTAFPAGQCHVRPDQRVLPGAEDGVHQPERLDPLLAGQGAGHLVPEHLLQDVECPPGLGNVQASPETVRRHLPGRRDDRLRTALVHTLDDEPEQVPNETTALRRAGRLVVPRLARFERGNSPVDHPVLGAGQDC